MGREEFADQVGADGFTLMEPIYSKPASISRRMSSKRFMPTGPELRALSPRQCGHLNYAIVGTLVLKRPRCSISSLYPGFTPDMI